MGGGKTKTSRQRTKRYFKEERDQRNWQQGSEARHASSQGLKCKKKRREESVRAERDRGPLSYRGISDEKTGVVMRKDYLCILLNNKPRRTRERGRTGGKGIVKELH